MQATQLIPSFNSGELSPFIHLRSDLEKYQSGCRLLENMMITPYGGVRRRPGFKYVAEAKYGTRQCRLVKFQYSVSDNYVMEVGHEYIRFFKANGQVMNGATPYEISSPYQDTEIFQLQLAQINDIAYIVHPNHPPHKLSRYADDNWTLNEVPFDYPCMRDENLDSSLTIAASAVEGSGVTLTASSNYFTANHVGAYYQLQHDRNADEFEMSIGITGNAISGTLEIEGGWQLTTAGTWQATVVLQRSDDDGTTWTDEREFIGSKDRNVSASGEESSRVLYRIQIKDYVTRSGSGVTARLEATEGKITGLVKITGYTSQTSVTATVINRLKSTNATEFWSEGAWSDHRGYPRSVVYHEGRIMYGGNNAESQRVWGSGSDSFEDFRRSTDDDGSFAHDLAAGEQNTIQWMTPQKDLVIGTSGGEWVMSGQKDAEPLSPTNVRIKRHSAFGSEYIQGQVVNDVMLFVQRGGRKIRELVYSIESDGYVAPDLTMLAEHIAEGGIVQTAFQQQRDAILWNITGNGNLVGLTYERSQNVVGWHRHVTDGVFESAASISGETEDDLLWVSVKRNIDGNTKRYIEFMPPDQFRAQNEDDEQDDLVFTDSAIKQETPGATEVTGLNHLEGKKVQILADGAVLPSRIVTGGKISFDQAQDPDGVDVAVVGLPYESLLQPMGLEIGLQNGTSVGRFKKIHGLVIYFYRSSGCEAGYSRTGDFDKIPFRDSLEPLDNAPGLYTGPVAHDLDAGHDLDASFILKQNLPLPMTVLAIVPKFNIYGDKT